MVLLSVYDGPFLLGMAAPKQKHYPLSFTVQTGYHLIGETFPPQVGMRVCLACLHCEHSIEQEHPLLSPGDQMPMIGDHETRDIPGQFFVDVNQRRRHLNPGLHREAETMSLVGAVIGILPEDHHLHLVKFCIFEGVEHVDCWWIDHPTRLPGLTHKGQGLFEILLLFLCAYDVSPRCHLKISPRKSKKRA